MNRQEDHIDELIGKYLAGEAEADEIAFIESWAGKDEVNQKYIEQFSTIFQKAAQVREFQVYDTDAAWTKLKANLRSPGGKVIPIQNRSPFGLIWRIAATVIVAVGIGYFTYTSFSSSAIEPFVVETAKKIVTDTLPDGSSVVLNRETKLAYSFDKKKQAHTVKLSGEAFFSIHHDDSKTFIIDLAGVFIRDIGTSFNVKAYPESNTIEVVVEEGEVMFYSDEDSGIYLRENGKGVYNKDTKTFTIDQPEPNALAYTTKFFSFSNTDLVSVVEALNDVYDKKIILHDNLKNCHLTVSFNNETQEEIVTIIAETLGLTVTEADGKIKLEGPGCED